MPPKKSPTLESLQTDLNTAMGLISELGKAGAANTADIMSLQEEVDELEKKVKTHDDLIAALTKSFVEFKDRVENLKTPAGVKIDEIYELLTTGTPDQWQNWRVERESTRKAETSGS